LGYLFNDASSVRKVKMPVSDDLKRMWMNMIVAYYK